MKYASKGSILAWKSSADITKVQNKGRKKRKKYALRLRRSKRIQMKMLIVIELFNFDVNDSDVKKS